MSTHHTMTLLMSSYERAPSSLKCRLDFAILILKDVQVRLKKALEQEGAQALVLISGWNRDLVVLKLPNPSWDWSLGH